MYIPPSFREERPEEMLAFIASHPFGALVTARTDGLFASHLPFVIDRSLGPHGTLLGHIARANPHHKDAPESEQALAIFTGPQAYITPRWYPSKAEHGKVVPTWNYVAVHAYGTLRFRHDEEFLRAQLGSLTAQLEGTGPVAWKVADAPPGYVAQQLKAIVGLQLEISTLEGKWKMSQNRDVADIDGVIAGLSRERGPSEISDLVRAKRPKRQ